MFHDNGRQEQEAETGQDAGAGGKARAGAGEGACQIPLLPLLLIRGLIRATARWFSAASWRSSRVCRSASGLCKWG
jgi:hypothetical protein